MTEALIDHLWQSTWFALAAALLVLVFRNNSASIRFRIWLAASAKFLIPLPLFVFIGEQLPWPAATPAHPASAAAMMMNQLAAPAEALLASMPNPGSAMPGGFGAPGSTTLAGLAGHSTLASSSATHPHWSVWTIVLTIWAAGFATVFCLRLSQWLKLNSIAWSANSLALSPSPAPEPPSASEAPSKLRRTPTLEVAIPVRETSSSLEPGIFGVFWPVLLLPKGIAARLTPQHLETIIAHELHHWRRKDNLTAAIHMIVEALFWFHPLVWWLGQRMLVERERAVDEAVIHSGSDRQIYAEGILKVCQFYVEPPLPCTSGVSGGTLRKRIEDIMTNRTLLKLHLAKKCLLSMAAVAGIGGPIAIGLLSAPYAAALAQQPASIVEVEMKHYENSQWKFSLDIPKRWNAFPPVPTNSPFEVMRFQSSEAGTHALIVFRNPHDPQESPTAYVTATQNTLAKHGLGNFATNEVTIGGQKIVTLDFDTTFPNGQIWSCRQYFFFDGTLVYVLGFGTTNREAMFPLYDKMARSFVATIPAT